MASFGPLQFLSASFGPLQYLTACRSKQPLLDNPLPHLEQKNFFSFCILVLRLLEVCSLVELSFEGFEVEMSYEGFVVEMSLEDFSIELTSEGFVVELSFEEF
jgi:hypothetical protein